MRIYLAAPFIEKEKMPEYAAIIEVKGHHITHKWWEVESKPNRTNEELEYHASLDAGGVYNADVVILYNSSKSEGKAVEQGIAIASGIPIIGIGSPGEHSKNIFHYLSCYTWVTSLEEALDKFNDVSWSNDNFGPTIQGELVEELNPNWAVV